MSLSRRRRDLWLPIGGLSAVALGALATLPETWHWIDASLDWTYAARMLFQGRWAEHGSNITGAGYNGPLVVWFFQAVLWLWLDELAIPLATTTVALGAAAWGGWLLSRGEHGRLWAWRLLLLVSCPVIFELSRIGIDLSLLPIMAPATVAIWALVDRRRGRLYPYAVAGAVLAVGMQIYVIYAPVVLCVGGALAWRALRSPRNPAAALALLALGFLVVHGPVVAAGLGRPQVQHYGSLGESLAVIGRMAAAYPVHLADRATAVAPLLARPMALLGWLNVLAPLAAVVLLRGRLSTLERCAVAIALISYALVSYPDETRYHHFVHVLIVIVVAQALLARLLLLERTRLVAGTVAVLQLAFLGAVQLDARQTGFVVFANAFPAGTLRGERHEAPTLRTRGRVRAALNEAGLTTAELRRQYVHGDRVLPFLENSWLFLSDRDSPVYGAAPPSVPRPAVAPRDYLLQRCDPGASGAHLAPELCLQPWSQPPLPVYRGPATAPVPLRSLRDEPFPLPAARQGTAPFAGKLRLDVRAVDAFSVRYVRPTRIPPYGFPGALTMSPELPLRGQTNAYTTAERTYDVPPAVTQVTVWMQVPPYFEIDAP